MFNANGMEGEVDRAARNGVAIAHDGPYLGRRSVCISRTRTYWPTCFQISTVVNRPPGPSAPMGMVRAEVVAEFMRHDIQVPTVNTDGIRTEIPKIRRKTHPIIVRKLIASNPHIGDTAGAGIAASRKEVRKISLNNG